MENLLELEKVKNALAFLREDDERTLREQLELCQIPAPSGEEQKRADWVFDKMQEAGLQDVHIDEVGNVLGKIPGTGDGPTVLFAAHTDTVFSAETDLTIRRDGERYLCPGINDDTRGVAELLTVARAMVQCGLRGRGDVIFCANVCEEGLGDLKGVKYLFRDHKVCDYFISIDDTLTGGIIYKATGSERYKAVFHGPGGHSFTAFGTPNPIHAMGRAIASIADFQVLSEPKTTFNVGIVEGGTSINTIAEECSLMMDLRSTDGKELTALAEKFKAAVAAGAAAENSRWNATEEKGISVEFFQVGQRPAGVQSEDCEIVQAAVQACELTDVVPKLLNAASTDANVPISLGIPAITVGQGGIGGATHTVHEWFEPVEAYRGPQRDLLLILKLTGICSWQN